MGNTVFVYFKIDYSNLWFLLQLTSHLQMEMDNKWNSEYRIQEIEIKNKNIFISLL